MIARKSRLSGNTEVSWNPPFDEALSAAFWGSTMCARYDGCAGGLLAYPQHRGADSRAQQEK
jgi:hypothetical protein